MFSLESMSVISRFFDKRSSTLTGIIVSMTDIKYLILEDID